MFTNAFKGIFTTAQNLTSTVPSNNNTGPIDNSAHETKVISIVAFLLIFGSCVFYGGVLLCKYGIASEEKKNNNNKAQSSKASITLDEIKVNSASEDTVTPQNYLRR